ncbi:MAG TPA: 16S rRNA (cytidine(1402)-2'-O)-methyltransferase [Verrucomicrobiae bacterium]|nr:16S rRNA (cytidine(1402)-2'-O)-methyltransferase [Verrucomicrobiae bacterium]
MKETPPLVRGTLYLVATPIGNLEDITARALRVLRECDVIAAEDTRHTGQLLHAYEIKKPLISYFKFNETKRSEEILGRLREGQKIVLVTDAGSPGISDPGGRVVRAAIQAGLRVESVPGPCALVTALTASGLPADEFHFAGFLPHKSSQRLRRLEQLKPQAGTIILYESPYRVEKLLSELMEVMPDREVVLARELTKKFEEFLRGKPKELLDIYKRRAPKGEFVVLIGPGNEQSSAEVKQASAPVTTVGALIYNQKAEVLMIRTHKWSDLWGIPGGKIKFGEAAEDALRREIKEETALEVEAIKFVLVQDCIHSKEFYRDAHFVLLNYTCMAPGEQTVQLNDEAETYQWLPTRAALKLPLNQPTRILLEAVL